MGSRWSPSPPIVNSSAGDWLPCTATWAIKAKSRPTPAPRKTRDPPNGDTPAPHLTVTKKAWGQGGKHPGALCAVALEQWLSVSGPAAVRLWASVNPRRMNRVAGKETMGSILNISSHSSALGGRFLRLHASSLRQPPPQGHTLPRAYCLEAQRLPWAPGSTADKQVRGA